MRFSIVSATFDADQEIPEQYTCDDKNLSPPLTWTGTPKESQSLVLIMDDPDAPDPDAPKMTWVHWVLYNLPPDSEGLDEAVPNSGLPAGTLQGINSWDHTGYGGPCPPIGRHRYFFKLYALDCTLPDLNHPDKDKLLKQSQGHVLAQAVLMGTYQRRP